MGTRLFFGATGLVILVGTAIRTVGVASMAASQRQWILVMPELISLLTLVVATIALQLALRRPLNPSGMGEVTLVTLSAATAAVVACYPGTVAYSLFEAFALVVAIVIATALAAWRMSGRTSGAQAACVVAFAASAMWAWELAIEPLKAIALVNPLG